MKKIIGLSLCLGFSSLAFAAETETPPPAATQQNMAKQTLVTVNGYKITGTDLLIFNTQQGGKAIKSEQAQIALMNQMINTLVVAQAAEASKLDQNPQVQKAVNMARLQVLAEIQAQTYLSNNPITPEQIKAAYDQQYSPENMQEYDVAHILVGAEDKAKTIIVELDKGGDFATLAKQHSSDGSKETGGSLGWLEAGQVIKPFADSMKTLKKGSYTKTPVASQYGWHIILLNEHRSKEAPKLESVQTEISGRLQQQQMAGYIGNLRKQAKIEVPEQPVATPAEAEPATTKK